MSLTAIVIYTPDPDAEEKWYDKTIWKQVGDRTWSSYRGCEKDSTRNAYIEALIPHYADCYFEIVGLDYFEYAQTPYH